MATEIRSNKSDKFGILSAVLCIVHCTLLPVAFAFITINFDNPLSELSFLIDFLFVIVSLTAVYFSARHSSSIVVKSALWIFVAIFILGIGLESITSWGKSIALFGSLGLIIAHFFNLRNCKRANHLSI